MMLSRFATMRGKPSPAVAATPVMAWANNADSVTVPIPTGVKAGDLLVIVTGRGSYGGTTRTVATPAGWTAGAYNEANTGAATSLFWKIAGASEAAVTVTESGGGGSRPFEAVMCAFRNVTTLTMGSIGVGTSVTSPPAAPSVTAPASGVLCGVFQAFTNTAILTPPASMSLQYQDADANLPNLAVATQSVGAGATGTRQPTSSQATTGDYSSFLFLVS